MTGDNGLGEVKLKDVQLLSDTLNYEGITAVKHGNGRDYWVLMPAYHSNKMMRLLVQPDGVKVMSSLELPVILESAMSQRVFSPDGKYFIRNSDKTILSPAEIDIFDFDRCSGTFTSHRRLLNPDNKVGISCGVAFSPNSQYIYFINRDKIIQHDMTQGDIATNGDTLLRYDGFKEQGFTAAFYTAQLAPDGKIYVVPAGSSKYFHIIHSPDKKGEAAKAQQRGIRLKSWQYATTPNFPNYRLGPLDDSPCDTLNINNIPVALFRYDQDTLNKNKVEFVNLSHHEPQTWLWDFGDDSAFSKERNPTYIYPKKGIYNACLTVTNTYGTHKYCRTVIIEQFLSDKTTSNEENILNIYPNPTEGIVHIDIQNTTNFEGKIIIRTLEGRTMHQQKIGSNNTIDLSNLQNGLYLVEIHDNQNTIVTEKLTILK
jgi:PKD repeat protein